MFESAYGLSAAILYPATVVLISAAGEVGNRAGLRHRGTSERTDDIGILTGAALGLLALLRRSASRWRWARARLREGGPPAIFGARIA
jgi:hypothetical protein